MLIRLVVNNLFSFGEMKEFNMLPKPRLKALGRHKYLINGFEVLKISSIYGANGAGKSNLVNSIKLFKDIVVKESLPPRISETEFKFHKGSDNKNQMLAVEIIEDNIPFYYAIEFENDLITTEELYISGLGKKKDQLIFERKTDKDGKTSLKLLDEFERDEKSIILKSVLLEEFIKPNKPILKLISNRDNIYLKEVKKVFNWFDKSLRIITPDSKPNALAHRIEIDKTFKKYAEEIVCSFNVGIKAINSEKKNIKDFFGTDNLNELDEIVKELEETPKKMMGFRSRSGDEIIIVKEKDDIYVKRLNLEHVGKDNISAIFYLNEESDGTIRLLDFIPMFQDVVNRNRVYIIDEIERSIHPLLVKELVKKFSFDNNTKGQLIFTTHESNLLDQSIFRQDEIWFVEKDKNGISDLYSLSDFKEHNTIDIRKGYLNGRYGSIPFLANLEDLNWHNYVINE